MHIYTHLIDWLNIKKGKQSWGAPPCTHVGHTVVNRCWKNWRLFIFLRLLLYAAKHKLQWNTSDVGVACLDMFTSRVETLHHVDKGLNKNHLTSSLIYRIIVLKISNLDNEHILLRSDLSFFIFQEVETCGGVDWSNTQNNLNKQFCCRGLLYIVGYTTFGDVTWPQIVCEWDG